MGFQRELYWHRWAWERLLQWTLLFIYCTRKTIDLDSFQPNCIDIFPQQMGFIFWVFYTDNIVHIILLIAYLILLISIWEESAGIVTTVWYHWRTRVSYQCWKRGELVSHLYSVLYTSTGCCCFCISWPSSFNSNNFLFLRISYYKL